MPDHSVVHLAITCTLQFVIVALHRLRAASQLLQQWGTGGTGVRFAAVGVKGAGVLASPNSRIAPSSKVNPARTRRRTRPSFRKARVCS